MTPIPLTRPDIGLAEHEAHRRVLDSGRLVLGPENQAFERDLARLSGRPHALATASGTAALHLALWALDLPAGGEVVVPAFTFPAPAHAALALGHRVRLVDVDADTWNLSAWRLEEAIGSATAAIIAVDQFGLVAQLDAIAKIAQVCGAVLVEDAACALGAALADRPAGSFGAAACFSFHPRKIVTTGEGGALVVSDDALAERARAMRNHGQVAPGRFGFAGLNFRLPETAAAMGRAQVERLTVMCERRRARVHDYQTRFADGPLAERVSWQRPPAGARHVWQTFAVVLPPGHDRARVIARMSEQGVEAAVATYALHRVGVFADPDGAKKYPVADALHERALALPLYSAMTADNVARVVDTLEGALA